MKEKALTCVRGSFFFSNTPSRNPSIPGRQLLCDWWWRADPGMMTGRAPQEREHANHSRPLPVFWWWARVSEVRGPMGPAARMESVDHWPLAIVDRPDSRGEPLCVSRRSPV